MSFLGKVFLGLIFISAIAVFIRSYYPSTRVAAAAALAPFMQKLDTQSTSVVADTSSNNNSYLAIEGTALMDTSGGLPAVPFIQFINADNTLVTKQLIFADSRGCNPNAGDIPCVPSYGASAYPVLSTGERISVKGYVKANRLLVYDITPL